MTLAASLLAGRTPAGKSLLLGTVITAPAGTPPTVQVMIDGATTPVTANAGGFTLLLNDRVSVSRIGSQVYVVMLLTQRIPDPTNWIGLGLSSGWATYGGSFMVPRVALINGIVRVQGLIKNGTLANLTTLTTLPAGMRPSLQLIFICASADQYTRLDVKSNGAIIIGGGAMTNGGYLSLDSISFPAEQ